MMRRFSMRCPVIVTWEDIGVSPGLQLDLFDVLIPTNQSQLHFPAVGGCYVKGIVIQSSKQYQRTSNWYWGNWYWGWERIRRGCTTDFHPWGWLHSLQRPITPGVHCERIFWLQSSVPWHQNLWNMVLIGSLHVQKLFQRLQVPGVTETSNIFKHFNQNFQPDSCLLGTEISWVYSYVTLLRPINRLLGSLRINPWNNSALCATFERALRMGEDEKKDRFQPGRPRSIWKWKQTIGKCMEKCSNLGQQPVGSHHSSDPFMIIYENDW